MTGDGEKRKVVVVGGGMGGMATALQVRAKGYEVILIEKNPQLGGIAAGFEENGVGGFYPLGFGDYSIFESLFELHDKKVEDYVKVIPQEEMYTRFIYDDKESLDIGGLDFSLAQMKKRSADHTTQYQQLHDFSRRLFEQLEDCAASFTAPSWLSKLKFVGDVIRAMRFLPCLKLSFAQMVEKYIKDEAVQMALNYRTSLLGENPYATGGIYIMMLHMLDMWGSFTAPGGIDGLVKSLEKLMLDVGIEVIKGDAVVGLEGGGRNVKEVLLQSGTQFACSHLISNISPYHLYGSLLPDKYGMKSRKRLKNIEYTPSLFSYHFTTHQCYSDIPSTVIVFPNNYKKFCSQLYDNEVMPDELLLGVYRPSFYDGSFCSPGTDHFSVYLPTPNLQSNISWEKVNEKLVEDIVARLEQYLLPNLSENLIDGFFRTPLDMKSQCSLPYGATFGPKTTRIYRGKDLFPNKDPDMDNLYLVGHSTLPGPGLNSALLSAQFVSDKINANPRNAIFRRSS